jgi:hypothetical protein
MDACPSLRQLGGHDQRRSVLAPTAKDKLDSVTESQTLNLCGPQRSR